MGTPAADAPARRVAGSRAAALPAALTTRHPDATAALLTAAAGIALLAMGVHGIWSDLRVEALAEVSGWWSLPLLAAGCGLMLVKRRHPVIAVGGGAALLALDAMFAGTVGMLLVFVDLLYSAANWAGARARRMLRLTIVAVTVGAIAVPLALGAPPATAALLGLQCVAILATPFWWGTSVRQGRELAELGRDRAVRAERARMARDLHDLVASHLSTVAIRSEVALSSPPDPARDRAALEAVRGASVAGLEQMRAMITLLRSGDDEAATVREESP